MELHPFFLGTDTCRRRVSEYGVTCLTGRRRPRQQTTTVCYALFDFIPSVVDIINFDITDRVDWDGGCIVRGVCSRIRRCGIIIDGCREGHLNVSWPRW